MPKHLIIFGAGASYGSDTIETPPLGEKLFDKLALFNPKGWGSIQPEQAQLFRKDFEAGMKDFLNKHPHAMAPLQRAMAVYFFNFKPRASNLYVKLAQKIKDKNWDGALATFNYERLLELSLLSQGTQPIVGQTAKTASPFELCLPHGCCHLFCESVQGNARGISFPGTRISTRGQIKLIGDPQQFLDRIQNDAFPPVMSYFEPTKRTTSGINFIDAQRQRFSELVATSSVIGIVGLRVRPHDEHIWTPLTQTPAKIVYCSGHNAATEFKTWASKARASQSDIILPNYFASGFEKLCSNLGL